MGTTDSNWIGRAASAGLPLEGIPMHTGFISCAHEDRRMVDRLRVHLAPLCRDGLAEKFWDDGSMQSGAQWSDEIEKRIAAADIFLLCLSAPYIASEYFYRIELPCIRQRSSTANGLIIPVVLKDCAWWGYLDNLQAVPATRGRIKPIASWRPADEGYAAAATQIRQAIEAHWRKPAPADPAPAQAPAPWPDLYYDGPHRLSKEAIDRAVRSVLGRHAPAK